MRLILVIFAVQIICVNLIGCGSDKTNQNTRYQQKYEVKMSAGDALSHFAQGNDYLHEGDFENAIIHFKKSTSLEPSKPDAWSALAHAHYLNGSNTEAEQYWIRALEISPQDVISLTGIANLYSKTNRKERAIETYKKSISIDPNNDSTNWNLAQFYLAERKYEQAINALDIVIKHTEHSDLKSTAQSQLNEVKKRIN